MREPIIVGGGPAGMAAAAVLVRHGRRPVLVDEAERPGGQVWRRPSAPISPDLDTLLGRAAAREHARVHAAFAEIADRVEHLPRHLAWDLQGGELFIAEAGRVRALRHDAIILATGATDRLLPLPGWTLPGVFSLGGAQAVLKDQGAVIGRRVVFAGASPLLHLVAIQYLAAGVEVAGVLDTTGFAGKLRAAPGLAMAAPRVLTRGLSSMLGLRRRGVPLFHGVTALAIEGESRAEAVRFRTSTGAERRIECDGAAIGFGLRAETQLLDLAGAPFAFDPAFRQWLPVADIDGRVREGLYAAGDGCSIGGAEAASLSGSLAAHALLADAGVRVPEAEIASLHARLRRLRAFQRSLARAFAWPVWLLSEVPADTILCRCEGVTIGTFREAAAKPLGPREVNRAKALTRCGMGRCQARFCGLAAAEEMARVLGEPVERMGRYRGQAPVKPISLGAMLDAEPAA